MEQTPKILMPIIRISLATLSKDNNDGRIIYNNYYKLLLLQQ